MGKISDALEKSEKKPGPVVTEPIPLEIQATAPTQTAKVLPEARKTRAADVVAPISSIARMSRSIVSIFFIISGFLISPL